jgi:hypothetical protein
VVLSAVDVDGFIAQCQYVLYVDKGDQPVIDSPSQRIEPEVGLLACSTVFFLKKGKENTDINHLFEI